MTFELALSIAQSAHAGQKDKLGEPYIQHPVAVAEIITLIPTFLACSEGQQNQMRQAALLHDVVEDTDLDGDDLIAAGISEDVISLVLVLTHVHEEPRADYIARIIAHPLARIVKLADITHNTSFDRVSRLPVEVQRKLEIKYSIDLAKILNGHTDDEEWFHALSEDQG